MQRRAAAIYATLFIVVAAGAYAMVGVAQEPTISLENPDHTLSSGDELTVNGRTYQVSVDGGSGELTWVNESARATETWDNGSTVTYDEVDYTVFTQPNASAVVLVEVQPLPENVTTVEDNGTTYVVVTREEEKVLVPESDYRFERFGLPGTERFTTGEQFGYDNETVTLSSVSGESATLAWTTSQENTVSASEGGNVTLNGRTFVAHFPDASTLELESDYGAYASDVRTIDTYQERVNGLWAASIISSLAAILLIGMAYMPSRY